MKNNFGFGKFELLTVLVLLIILIAYLMYSMLGDGNIDKKIEKMRDEAIQFNKAVYTNMDSFHNERVVYLEEVIEQGFFDSIKSPFSSNKCDVSESKVETVSQNERYVTLKCDDYLIKRQRSSDLSNVTIYQVGKWSTKKNGEDDEEKILYNCEKDGKEGFDDYYEEGYFLLQLSKEYSNYFYDITDVSDQVCHKIEKKYYRTIKEVK